VSALVDPDAHGHVDELVRSADSVLRVDQGRISRLGRVIPFARGGLAAGILGSGDDLEALAL
jgi:hypothetical protein